MNLCVFIVFLVKCCFAKLITIFKICNRNKNGYIINALKRGAYV